MDELKSAHLFRLADFYFIVIFLEIIVIFLEIIVVETLPFNTPSSRLRVINSDITGCRLVISELIVCGQALRPDQHITRNLRLLVAEDMVPFPGKEGTRPVGTGAERRRVGCWGNAPHSECGGAWTRSNLAFEPTLLRKAAQLSRSIGMRS